jgi:hypothetical protein
MPIGWHRVVKGGYRNAVAIKDLFQLARGAKLLWPAFIQRTIPAAQRGDQAAPESFRAPQLRQAGHHNYSCTGCPAFSQMLALILSKAIMHSGTELKIVRGTVWKEGI